MTSKRVGVGIIGCGIVGQSAHLANYAALSQCEVIGVADLRPNLAIAAAQQYHVPNVYQTHHEMLEDPRIEAVVVVTRRPATGPIVLDALNAGRHVLSEKPMAHSVAQARTLTQAQPANRQYAVGFMKRYDSAVHTMRAAMSDQYDGALGKLQCVRAFSLHGEPGQFNKLGYTMTEEERPEGLVLWPEAPDWMPAEFTRDYAAFLNVHIHMLNLMRFLFGNELDVRTSDITGSPIRSARLNWHNVPIDLAMRDQSVADWDEGVDVVYERGTLHLRLPPPFSASAVGRVWVSKGPAIEELPVLPGWAFAAQARAFIEAIREGAQPVNSARDSIDDLVLAEELWRVQLSTNGRIRETK